MSIYFGNERSKSKSFARTFFYLGCALCKSFSGNAAARKVIN